MKDAANYLEGGIDVAITNVPVSVDGTWQKRGFSSLNGVVTAISVDSGKILDTEIMSRKCKGCVMGDCKINDPIRYEDWHASHDCGLNYKGSAPNMEKAGSVSIFQRSIKNGLRYTTFYGDGDTKSFNAVENIYGDDSPVIKRECIGHYQKRVGNRLRKLRKEKNLGGKKRLTNKKLTHFKIILA